MMTYNGPYTIAGTRLATQSGNYFDFQTPENCHVRIQDIALGLSNTCRFGGQIRTFYSVAEHSVKMSQIIAPQYAYIALMHDAAEAFTGDIPSPLKHLLPDFQKIEARCEKRIQSIFKCGYPTPAAADAVKRADMAMLAAEKKQVLVNADKWPEVAGILPAEVTCEFWTPNTARLNFLDRFVELCTAMAYADV